MANAPDIIDGEHEEQPRTGLSIVRHPAVPVTVNDLAALKGEALEIIDARIQILETARKRAIRMTSPEDWVLFKAKDDRVTGYLQDAGCDRIRDITGIEVFDVSTPERIPDADGKGGFMYLISGSGRSRLTMQVVEAMEGGRHSSDDFCKDKRGAALELAVRKAARANLDGNIVRELAGLKSVPAEVLVAAWEGTGKTVEHCRKGRGFGSQDERLGAAKEGVPDVPPPQCPVCKIPLVYRSAKGDRGAFYGCKQYDKHPNDKVIVDAAKWVAEQEQRKTQAAAAPQQQQPTAAADAKTKATTKQQQRPEPVSAGDIFGRQPGEEG